MTPLTLAQKYMEIFFSGERLEELHELFTDDLCFEGPFYRFDSAEDYINSLMTAPPKDMGYQIIHAYENAASACLIYRLTKPGIDTTMAQTFEIRDQRIHHIQLIFDSAAFK